MPDQPLPSDNKDNANDPMTQKLGKKMMLIAWIIALGLLTTIFGDWEERQRNPNFLPKSQQNGAMTEVSLLRNRYGHYVTSGNINGKAVTFLIDTGASDVAIPGELQQKLGLFSGSAHYAQTANGDTKAYNTVINSLKIGEIELFDVKGSIIPKMQGEEILLGMSVLKQLEINQKGNQLILRQPH